jgi:hypothetical protein
MDTPDMDLMEIEREAVKETRREMAAERAAQRGAYPAVVPTFDGRPATAEVSLEILGDLPTDGEG